MKRCPECRRDYFDDTLSFCLADGTELVHGLSDKSFKTAILPESTAGLEGVEGSTRIQMIRTDETAAQPRTQTPRSVLPRWLTKAIPATLLILATFTLAGFFGYRYLRSSNPRQIDSIAVMPFINDSGNAEMEYLSDGMTETLIGSLSQIAGLNVKARSSVFRYKGKETDARTIGKDLGVQAVLNGRLVQRGDQLTLSLELIDAANENVIWQDKYERPQADIVKLQSDIARDVSSKLKLKFTSADELKLAKRYTRDPEVYRLYLQGRYHWNKRQPREVTKGVEFFRQAVEKDPNFALGYVGLADSNEDSNRPQKLEYIRRALELDPDLAEAHASLGYQLMCKQDWIASEREFARAKELDPNYAQAYAWNAMRLTMIGKYNEALSEIDRALALEPTANGINFCKAAILGVSGRGDEAIQHFKRIIDMDPTFSWPYATLARQYFFAGDIPAAVEQWARSVDLEDDPARGRRLREAFASGGWKAFIEEAKTLERARGWISIEGPTNEDEKEKLIARLQERADRGDFWLFQIRSERTFDSLRGDPRFQEILKRFDPPQ